MGRGDDAVPIAELLDERRHLLDVAYWMLGSSGEAERVVDDTYRRWYELSDPARAGITAPRFWLVRVTGSICLERLALSGREGDAGRPGGEDGPDSRSPAALLQEEIGAVLLDALDSLSPAERAAFVLNDVFGMAPGTVADIVRQQEPECAEPADRARHSLRARRARPTAPRQHDAVARAVQEACVREDEALLASLLAPDATAFFDGGGKVRALVKPVRGSARVARSLLILLAGRPRTALQTHSVNGRTGFVMRYDQQVAAVISLDIAGPQVVQVWVILNPDKLRTWNQPDDPVDVPSAPDSSAGEPGE
ncbi:RNA polymerase subunit sigma [Streptomyces sp. NPDC001982]|uniref:RNA polymerase subunit sigma n=1 Tax=unclassified Streptomyces TaxID=2593676 RepID=UPI00332763D2